MNILPVHDEIKQYLKKHNISHKFDKQLRFLVSNPKHPSLNIELLEPRQHGIYSFRIDKKYRCLFILRKDKQKIEILTVTDHYK